MSDPIKTTQEQSEDKYVSPTSDETLSERYERVRAEEEEMGDEERLEAVRAPSPLLDEPDAQ